MVCHGQSRFTLGGTYNGSAAGKAQPSEWGFELVRRTLASRCGPLSALLHLPLGPLRRVRQGVWQAQDHPISPFRGQILIA